MILRLQALCGIFNNLLKRQVSHGYYTYSLLFPLLDPTEITRSSFGCLGILGSS
jgi:hypothetical protein